MTHEVDSNPPLGPEDLIAYLDGEMDADAHQQVERRLAEDPQWVQRLREHQQAWDFLDELPREDASANFTQTTLSMVAVSASNDAEAQARRTSARRKWLGGATGISLVLTTLAGFWLGATSLARLDHHLLRDLPVIENLEALQQVENVAFLQALQNEGLFVAEVSDGP